MPKQTLHISEADDNEQGSFCDRNSGYHYDNGNLTDVTEQEANAIERGDSTLFWDAPIDDRDPYEIEPGQRFNMLLTETDSHGNDTPSRLGPGR